MNREKREKLLSLQKQVGLSPEKRALLENRRFKMYLSDLTSIKKPPYINKHPLMQKIFELSDEAKVLALRALIYNTHLTPAFLSNDGILMDVVEKLTDGNKKLNTQMKTKHL